MKVEDEGASQIAVWMEGREEGSKAQYKAYWMDAKGKMRKGRENVPLGFRERMDRT